MSTKSKSNSNAANATAAIFKAIESRDLKAFAKTKISNTELAALRARDGQTALEYAIAMRADEIAMAMIDAGVPVSASEANLVWAVLVRRPDLVKRFIDLGADVHVRSMMGTPLSVAAGPPASMRPGSDEDLLQIMNLLIDAGTDVNAGTSRCSPLQSAIEKGATNAALLLIHSGAKIDRELIELAEELGHPDLGMAMKVESKRPKKPKPPEAKVVSGTFDREVAKLEALCGTKVHPLDGLPGAVSVHVDSRKKVDVAKIQAEFLKSGRFVYAIDSDATRLAMMPTDDKYKVIEAMATNGNNYDVSNADIIRWLRDLEKEQPFILTGVGMDFLAGRFTTKIKRPAELAKRMYEFCPDIVEQGVESVEALEKLLCKEQDFYFWWD